jgi:hypothetical protein
MTDWFSGSVVVLRTPTISICGCWGERSVWAISMSEEEARKLALEGVFAVLQEDEDHAATLYPAANAS